MGVINFGQSAKTQTILQTIEGIIVGFCHGDARRNRARNRALMTIYPSGVKRFPKKDLTRYTPPVLSWLLMITHPFPLELLLPRGSLSRTSGTRELLPADFDRRTNLVRIQELYKKESDASGAEVATAAEKAELSRLARLEALYALSHNENAIYLPITSLFHEIVALAICELAVLNGGGSIIEKGLRWPPPPEQLPPSAPVASGVAITLAKAPE